MVDKKSDFTKPRTKLNEFLPNYVRTDVIDNVFENTFNRFMTKEDTLTKLGYLGSVSNNNGIEQIPETTVHRQAFQLQPLAYTKIGDVNYAFSQKDILRKLAELGVNINNLDAWGSTEQFNYIPPVDPDKIINFSDYYWYDENDPTATPDYITIKNRCAVAIARYKQKQREIEDFGTHLIEQVDTLNGNTILRVRHNVADQLEVNGSVDIVNGQSGVNGTYQIESVYYEDGYTVIELNQDVGYTSTAFGSIEIASSLAPFITERNLICTNSAGWDSQPWDDSDNGFFWDGADPNIIPANDWSSSNKWFHRLDLTTDQVGVATRATMPIIEYLDTVQLNEWANRTHIWRRFNSLTLEWEETTQSPTRDDIYTDSTYQTVDPQFFNNWLYDGLKSVEPTFSRQESSDPVLLATYNTDTPDKLLSRAVNNTQFSFPLSQHSSVLPGSDVIRVYVDGVRQIGNYIENTDTTVVKGYSTETVIGIQFTNPIPLESQVEVYISAAAEADEGLEAVPVRVSESPLIVEIVDLTNTFKLEQVKNTLGQYPIFNVFDIFGEFLFASPIFYFKTSPDSAFNPKIGKRIATEGNQQRPVFLNDLVSEEGENLYTYFDLETDGLQTVWRTSYPESFVYVPERVDSNGDVPIDLATPTDWEIVDQIMFNSTHETWREITFTQLVAHFQSMIAAQPNPGTLVSSPSFTSRLQYRPDYGKGGTIKEHNYAFDMLISSVINQISDPVKIFEFAARQYNELQNFVLEYITSTFVERFTEHTGSLSSFSQEFINDTIQVVEENSSLSKLYGDSGTYNEELKDGIRNWIATLPLLSLVQEVKPVKLIDDKLNISAIRHHDGHALTPRLAQALAVDLYNAINSSQASPGRLRGWSPSQSADGGTLFSDRDSIPLVRLHSQDTWLEQSSLYVFDVIAISSSEPSIVNAVEGDLWANSTDSSVHQLQRISGQLQWVQISNDYTSAWKLFEINHTISDVFFEIENRLFDVCALEQRDIRLSVDDIIETQLDRELFDLTMQDRFLTFTRNRDIVDPYVSDYDPTNPFTWNYSQIPVSSPLVLFPYTKNVELWGARYQTIYRNVFGTEYPHLEPWVLQGYSSKPEWWDEEYAGTSRRWSSSMWDNIKNAVIPPGRAAPPTPPKLYSFVCVNTTDGVTHDGYGPDDLLPPFWEPDNSSPLSIADSAASTETFLRNFQLIASSSVDEGYEFGDESPVEHTWRQSLNYQYDLFISLFAVNPVKTLFHTWGYDLVNVGELLVNAETQKVPSHSNVVFHGETMNGQPYVSYGINQWFVNYNRFRDHDNILSGFSPLWRDWSPQLAYQTDTFLDARSINLSTANYALTAEDYNLFVKKSRAIQSLDIPSVQYRTSGYGESVFRNQRKVPKGAGSDWLFAVDVPASWISSITYFPTKDSEISTINVVDSTFTFDERHWWNTGDVVTLDSLGDVPRPLTKLDKYFVINIDQYTIQLASSKSQAETGSFIQFISDMGTRSVRVQTVTNGFLAKGGSNTSVEWKRCETVPVPITKTLPLEIKGVQGLISLLYGIEAFHREQAGIRSNPDQELIDPDTGRVLGWQTEIERSIDLLFSGTGLSNPVRKVNGNSYVCTADPVTDLINAPGLTHIHNGTEIFFYSAAILPQGLVTNTPYYAIPISPGVFRVATSAANADAGLYVDIQTNGAGLIYASTYPDDVNNITDWIEVNPYRNSFWVPTPNGVLSNIVRGPYADIQSEITIQDNEGNPLKEADVFVLRYDKGTKIQIPSNSDTLYQSKHYSAGRFYIDGYEHVIMFDDYTTTGNLLYDSFLGLKLRGVDVASFVRQRDSFNRPSVGGYLLNGEELMPNFEKLTVDMGEMYGQFSNDQYGDFAKSLLGYTDLEFFDKLAVKDQTKFTFWRGMIQAKGSNRAIDAFINSRQFVDARVDEFWAYRVSTFGDVGKDAIAEFKVAPLDFNGSDIWTTSGPANTQLIDYNSQGPEDPITPPTDICAYDYDVDNVADYAVLEGTDEFKLGVSVDKVIPRLSSPSTDMFEFLLDSGSNGYIRAASTLLEQYRISSDVRGDYITDVENQYGIQYNIDPLVPTQNINDSAIRDYTFKFYLIGISNGIGNVIKVEFDLITGNNTTSPVRTMSLYVLQYTGGISSWERFAEIDVSTLVNFDDSLQIGIYYDKSQKKVGIGINGNDLGLIQPNDPSYLDSEYIFGTAYDHFGSVLEIETNIDSGDPLVNAHTISMTVETDPSQFTAGFPLEQTYAVCSTPSGISGCTYPLVSSVSAYESEYLASLETLYPELSEGVNNTFVSLPLTQSVDQMEVTYAVQPLALTAFEYGSATSETNVSRVVNSDSRFTVEGDADLTGSPFYGMSSSFTNIVLNDMITGRLFAGIDVRGAASGTAVGNESFIRIKLGQEDVNSTRTNKLVIEYGTNTLSSSDVQTREFIVSLAELISTEISLYFDTANRRVGWVANGVDNGYLKDSGNVSDYIFPNDNSFKKMAISVFTEATGIDAGDVNVGNEMHVQLDMDTTGFAFPVDPFCSSLDAPDDIIDTQNFYSFDWGSTDTGSGDSVVPVTGFGDDDQQAATVLL